MPILASFEGIERLANFMLVVFAIWASSGMAALVAFAQAFPGRNRRLSKRFAIASIIGSFPISMLVVFAGFLASEFVFVLTCLPWIVGTAALLLGYKLSKLDGENGKQDRPNCNEQENR
jgi:hypothetical protein